MPCHIQRIMVNAFPVHIQLIVFYFITACAVCYRYLPVFAHADFHSFHIIQKLIHIPVFAAGSHLQYPDIIAPRTDEFPVSAMSLRLPVKSV
jgi:hypothetical protein